MPGERKFCVVCSRVYRDGETTCPDDGTILVIEADDSSRPSRLGHVLGNYRLLRMLGEGGVGTVYEAEHVRLGRKVALKLLHPDVIDSETVTRFFNEARAVNEIKHANIIDVEDFVTTPAGEHYMVMELLSGEDLRSVLSRERQLTPERVARIGEQVASALHAVHKVNIIHRDLKPDNVFLVKHEGKEHAKLLDFGVAKFTQDATGLTRAGMTMGTPQYMAPEQILAGQEVGTSSDIYAMGILMYELLTGMTPFNGSSIAAILRAHVSEAVVPPSMRRGEPLPPVLEAAVMKCLEKEPANRFASAEELAEALRAEVPVEVPALVNPPKERAFPRKRSSGGFRAVTGSDLSGPIAYPPAPASHGRARQLVPALLMAAAAAVIHFWPRAETRADSTVSPIAASAPVAAAPPSMPAREPMPPPTVTLSLTSEPAGAEVFLDDGTRLGRTPTTVALPMSTAAVTLVAKFSDGRETRATLVPDAARAVALVAPKKAIAVKPATGAKPAANKPPTTTKPATTRPAKPTGTDDRDATLDPFQ